MTLTGFQDALTRGQQMYLARHKSILVRTANRGPNSRIHSALILNFVDTIDRQTQNFCGPIPAIVDVANFIFFRALHPYFIVTLQSYDTVT